MNFIETALSRYKYIKSIQDGIHKHDGYTCENNFYPTDCDSEPDTDIATASFSGSFRPNITTVLSTHDRFPLFSRKSFSGHLEYKTGTVEKLTPTEARRLYRAILQRIKRSSWEV